MILSIKIVKFESFTLYRDINALAFNILKLVEFSSTLELDMLIFKFKSAPFSKLTDSRNSILPKLVFSIIKLVILLKLTVLKLVVFPSKLSDITNIAFVIKILTLNNFGVNTLESESKNALYCI